MSRKLPIIPTILVALAVLTMIGLGFWQLERRKEKEALIVADCRTGAEGPGVAIELGWSKNPNAGHAFSGGLVSGVIAPDRMSRMRLVAASPGPGLVASAPPSPDIIPNNHLSYAVQWFLFAAIAVIIYLLALRGRWRREPANG